MFRKILIANRGEIARRIAGTAEALGIQSVMVYSDADADALHVREAREAVRLGEPPASASYLNIPALIDAARRTGAEAIHPGYGFLSENADFARACAQAGLVFIGPSVEAIEIMGSKSEAKALMAKCGIPLVPGYYGEDQGPEFLANEAARIGFPVLIKASAGGGGRGMRVVRNLNEFAGALASAQREAQSAFANAHVLLEKYVENPRHIEVQIFGDRHGNLVHLFERDCSLQRRHQKVIEEAPAVLLSAAQRVTLYDAAIAAGRAVDYVGAGTVEFVVAQDGSVYFIEMNTRLQVEHPVTEEITGLDLVDWQLRVAAGEPLPLAQDEIESHGHAIEVRLYAEDPAQDFRPAVGHLARVVFPAETDSIRVDTGVESGDQVTPWYDAMVAKLIVLGHDRADALQRMSHALAATHVAGLNANLSYLRRIIDHPGYVLGGFTTHFVEEERAALLPAAGEPPVEALLLAAAGVLRGRKQDTTDARAWAHADAFRLNHPALETLQLATGEGIRSLQIERDRGALAAHLPDGSRLPFAMQAGQGDLLRLEIEGRRLAAPVVLEGNALEVFLHGERHAFQVMDPLAHAGEEEAAAGSLLAPMPGAITALLVELGQSVTRGQPLLVLEAMKIEHTIVAPFDGTVSDIFFRQGQQVMQEGAELVRLAAADDAA